MTASKVESWIRAGYTILGTEGIDGLKIERLARVLRQNKSCFYYYFGGMTTYMNSLLQYHVRMANEIASEIRTCECIDPDFLLIVVRHKAFFLADAELIIRSKSPAFNRDCKTAASMINQQLLLLWRRSTDAPEDSGAALAYLDIIRHFFYSVIDAENIHYEYLHTLITETKDVLEKVSVERHTRRSSSKASFQ